MDVMDSTLGDAARPRRRVDGAVTQRHVAIVHDYLSERGGAERVVLSLTGAFPGSPVYTSVYDQERYPDFHHVDVRTSALNTVPLFRRHHRLSLPALPLAFKHLELDPDTDVVLCSSSGWAHGVHTELPKLVYCYNPARWLYQRHDYASTRRRYWVASAALNAPLRAWDQRAARSCDRYLAISSSVATRIRQVYGFEAEVVPPPTAFDAAGLQSPMPGIEPGYVVAVSRLLGYKNVAQVVEAFAGLPQQRLVVVGDGPMRHELLAMATPNVTITGRVTDSELRWLYANSIGLVSASYEDFGLTPVEAALFGKPSALLRAGGFLDTTIEGVTGLFFDAPEPVRIRHAVEQLVREPWEPAAIAATAERYSESGFARRMRQIVDEVASAHG